MKINTAREEKQRLTLWATRQVGEARSLAVPKAAKSAKRKTVDSRVTHPVAAFGVAPTSRKKDFKLAVRLYAGQDALREKLETRLRRFKSEVELVSGVRYEPRGITLYPGVSCGHYRITAGTLGGFVEDEDGYYILSNNHVLANSNFAFGGDPVLHPGPLDIEADYKVIAHLDRWIPLTTANREGLDAALALLDEEAEHFYPWTYKKVGEMKRSPVHDRYRVREVVKLGRTTGVTVGTVSAYELDGVALDYAPKQDEERVVVFDNQIEIIGSDPEEPFSQGGDSGSFILDRPSLKPYALLYGGGLDADGIDRTIAHFMGEVLDALDVEIVQ